MTPEIEFMPVTRDNWENAISLEVCQYQARFVASNVYSLAESKIFPECVPMAVYADGQMVGFMMYALDQEDQKYWICRLMIDYNFQGKGLGRLALKAAIEYLSNLDGCDEIRLSIQPDNAIAEKLYLSVGFKHTGDIVDDEYVMALKIK